jgi:ferritin
MKNDISALIEESINIELNVSEIYSLFHQLFQDDVEFWWKLLQEEKNHAKLIQSGQEHFEPIDMFPQNLLHRNLQDLKDTNSKLHSLIENIKNAPPSRSEAFNIALEIENSAGELHFQKFMSEDASSVIDEIFKRLNEEDKEHATRIRNYMKSNGIPIEESSIT